MNSVTKYMASRTLTKVDWNNSTLLEGELGDSVRELKESDGGEITTSGSSALVRSLLDLKLLDELNLLEMPYAVGAQLITTRATAAGERGVKQYPAMGNLKSAIGVVVIRWRGPDVQERGFRPCAVTNRQR
jgi:dihydrofolate reductase